MPLQDTDPTPSFGGFGLRCGRVQRENAPRGKKGDRANVHHYVVAGGANPTVQCDAVRSSPTRPLRIRASRLRRFGGRTVPGTAAAEQRDRNDKLEARVEGLEKEHDELAKELRRRLAAIEPRVEGLQRDDAQ